MKKIIGITGGSGGGKGAVCNILKSLGAHIIDTDVTYKNTIKKGMPALCEIKAAFGDGVILPNGELDRKSLAKIVFNSPDMLHKLNTITHKYITEEIKKEIEKTKEDIIIIDAPALFESGINNMCLCVIWVKADEEKRTERIMARDKMTYEAAKERIKAQKSDEFFLQNCDYCIENNDDLESLYERVEQIFKEVLDN